MDEKGSRANIYYKCRLCGEVFVRYSTPGNIIDARLLLFDLLNGDAGERTVTHCCSPTAIGVADVMGSRTDG